MIVRFVKDASLVDGQWVSTNLFAIANERDSRRPKLKKLIKILKEHGIKSKIATFIPTHWTVLVDAVVIDQEESNEAFFIILANAGIEV